MLEDKQSGALDDLLIDACQPCSEERLSTRHPLIIPKLPIGKLLTDKLREQPRTKSHRLYMQEEEELRQQARSLLMQGRFESIRFLSPKNHQKEGYVGRLKS